MIYIKLVKSLSRKFELEREYGNILEIRIEKSIKSINHSQFIDDTLFFGGAYLIIVNMFKRIMDSFLEASGGAINKMKCQIVGWHTSTQVMLHISRILQLSLVEEWTFF